MDDTYGNKAWASVAKLEPEEVCRMEREFLGFIGFNVFVSWEEWKRWTGEMEFALGNYTIQRHGVSSGLEGLVWRIKVWDERDQERVDSGGVLTDPAVYW